MQGIKYKLRGENHTKGIANPCITSPNLKNGRRCFHQFWGPGQTCWGRKSLKSEASSSSGSNASKIEEFEDPYKEIWQKHWAMCSLKLALDRLLRRSRTGITHRSESVGGDKYLMERQFHAPRMESIILYVVWSGQRGKFVKEEAAIKCEGEGDDDDAMRWLGKPLIEYKWSCQAWRVDQDCMNTFKSCMKDHGSATIRRYVRKSSSMTLNEAQSGRQPGFYLDIYTWPSTLCSLIEPSSNIVQLL
jgi:hypothetical protein